MLNNFQIIKNVHFNDRSLVGGLTPVTNLLLDGNLTYRSTVELGYSNNADTGATLRNNYFGEQLHLQLFRGVSVSDNTMVKGVALRINAPSNVFTDYRFDRNTYYQREITFPFVLNSVGPGGCSYYWFNKNAPGFGCCSPVAVLAHMAGATTRPKTYGNDKDNCGGCVSRLWPAEELVEGNSG